MTTLRDHQTELLGGAANRVVGVFVTPRPHLVLRTDQLEAHGSGGRLLASDLVGPFSRDEAELDYVAKSVRRGALDPQRVGDVGAVRPYLHQPGGEKGARSHRRSVPIDAVVVVQRPRGRGERGRCTTPRGELLARRECAKGTERE